MSGLGAVWRSGVHSQQRGAGTGVRRWQGPDGEETRVALPEREEVVPSLGEGTSRRVPTSLRF